MYKDQVIQVILILIFLKQNVQFFLRKKPISLSISIHVHAYTAIKFRWINNGGALCYTRVCL